jgi:hypothetical protein
MAKKNWKLETAPDLYVGQPDLHFFDLMIPLAMRFNKAVATRTFKGSLTEIQLAAVEIAPGGFNLCLSIRELIRSGYLFAGEILLRPLLERVAVLSYLHKNQNTGLQLWRDGWPHKSRPSIKTMIKFIEEPPRTLGDDQYPSDYSVHDLLLERVDHLNRLVHADPIGAYRNTVFDIERGRAVHLSGPNFKNPAYCGEIAMTANALMCSLIQVVGAIFPEATSTKNSETH